MPVDVAVAAGRLWLIWPEALISLGMDGNFDDISLLTLFSSRTADWGGKPWSPEGGLICSDGIWRAVDPLGGRMLELNPISSVVTRRTWEGPGPDALYPAPGTVMLAVSGEEASLVFPSASPDDASIERIPLSTAVPPLSMLAVSASSPIIAWRETGSSIIRLAGSPERRGVEELFTAADTREKLEGIPEWVIPFQEVSWGMDWAGPYLVLAGPGRLTALTFRNLENFEQLILEDPRLPDRWYRIRGGEGALLVHSPETGMLAVVTPEGGEELNDETGWGDFADLLEAHALDAGADLEGRGFRKEAEAYYGWLIPYIRAQRSRRPLSTLWPDMEEQAARLRMELRDKLD